MRIDFSKFLMRKLELMTFFYNEKKFLIKFWIYAIFSVINKRMKDKEIFSKYFKYIYRNKYHVIDRKNLLYSKKIEF